jgi:hypothetical protein
VTDTAAPGGTSASSHTTAEQAVDGSKEDELKELRTEAELLQFPGARAWHAHYRPERRRHASRRRTLSFSAEPAVTVVHFNVNPSGFVAELLGAQQARTAPAVPRGAGGLAAALARAACRARDPVVDLSPASLQAAVLEARRAAKAARSRAPGSANTHEGASRAAAVAEQPAAPVRPGAPVVLGEPCSTSEGMAASAVNEGGRALDLLDVLWFGAAAAQ